MPGLYTLPNEVPVGTSEIVPVNVDFSPYILVGDAVSAPLTSKLTQDGSSAIITPSDVPTVWHTTVAASPAPTASAFTVQTGLGAQLLPFDPNKGVGAGMILTVGARIGTVLSIVGDLITLLTPLSGVPNAGDVVTSTFVQQIIRGSQLAAKQTYRLDVTATLNAAKEMTTSTVIPCRY